MKASDIPPNATKLVMTVFCTTHKNQSTDFLAKHHGKKFYIGARRKGAVVKNVESISSGASGDNLKGKLVPINDVVFGCLHCANPVFFCECGVKSCYSITERHICPACGDIAEVEQFKSVKKVSEKTSGASRLLGNVTKLLTKK